MAVLRQLSMAIIWVIWVLANKAATSTIYTLATHDSSPDRQPHVTPYTIADHTHSYTQSPTTCDSFQAFTIVVHTRCCPQLPRIQWQYAKGDDLCDCKSMQEILVLTCNHKCHLHHVCMFIVQMMFRTLSSPGQLFRRD